MSQSAIGLVILSIILGYEACELVYILRSRRHRTYVKLIVTLLDEAARRGNENLTLKEFQSAIELGLIDTHLDKTEKKWIYWADRKKGMKP